MKPFLLLTTRPEDDVARAEAASFQRFSELDHADLQWIRLEREDAPRIRTEEISGIYLGGSPFTVSDPVESKSAQQIHAEKALTEVLDQVMEQDIPFLGACYGIGVLGTHAGATIDRTHGEPLGAVPITLTEAGREDPVVLEAGLPEVFTGLVGHKEAVTALPAHATVLATGEQCPVQMFRVGTKQYATQFHPEMDVPAVMERARAYRDHGYFDPGEMEDIFALLGRRTADLPPHLLRAFATVHARGR